MKSVYREKKLSMIVGLAPLLFLAGCVNIQDVGGLGCTGSCSQAPTQFLYAAGTGQILALNINQNSGALGSPLVMTGPNQIAGLSSTTGSAFTTGYLYVSDFLNDAVDGFSVNPGSGALTAISSSPFPLGGTPPGAGGLSAFSPDLPYLYATDLNAGTVAGFVFNSGNGLLTPVPGSPFTAGDTPVQAVQTELGNFLYISNLNDSAGGISAYSIDQSTGALTAVPGSPFPTGAPGSFPGPSALAVSANDNFLYVALVGTASVNNKIAAFSIDASTGGLTLLPTSPFTTGNGPLQMAILPFTLVTQSFLYTANTQDGTISAFTSDDSTGFLTEISGSPYAMKGSVGGIAAIPYFLYASDPQSGTIAAYTIDGNTGALTPISGSPFAAATSLTQLTIAIE